MTAFAFLSRDISIEKNYRLAALVKMATVFLQLAVFYYLSRALGKPGYFSYVFVGLLFSRAFQFWVSVYTESIRQEQYWGTAELIFLSPCSPAAVMNASVAGRAVLWLAEMAVYVAAGSLLFSTPLVFSLPSFVLIFLDLCMFAGFGLAAGSCIMYFKRGDPLSWVLFGCFDLLSGVYFSADVLPAWLQPLAANLPTTVALDAWRGALLSAGTMTFPAIAMHLCGAVLTCLAGMMIFSVAYRRVRLKGELGSY